MEKENKIELSEIDAYILTESIIKAIKENKNEKV